MARKISIFIILFAFVLTNTAIASAIGNAGTCLFKDSPPSFGCDTGLFCNPNPANPTEEGTCDTKLKIAATCLFKDNAPNAPSFGCDTGLFCNPNPANPTEEGTCETSEIKNIFGTIDLPNALKEFLQKNPTGAGGISAFLSNGVTLIYSVASIVLIFMLLWGAFEWLTSGGDKEKLASAQKRIINAIIGIFLFAVAFAVIQLLGTFTGFIFFKGQH